MGRVELEGIGVISATRAPFHRPAQPFPGAKRLSAFRDGGDPRPPLPVAGWRPEEQYCESCTERGRSLSPAEELLRGRGELEASETLGNTKGGAVGRDGRSGAASAGPLEQDRLPRPSQLTGLSARPGPRFWPGAGLSPSLPDAPPTPRLLRGPGRTGRSGWAG